MPIQIYSDNNIRQVDDLAEFSKDFHPISAAGGLVLNDQHQVLMIFRRGKWDLPKGKMEIGESPEICAAREVMEETGLEQLVQQRFLLLTYHTYSENGMMILKDTHWYLFTAPGTQTLQPQHDEDITNAEWIDISDLDKYTAQTYTLIADVIASAKPELLNTL